MDGACGGGPWDVVLLPPRSCVLEVDLFPSSDAEAVFTSAALFSFNAGDVAAAAVAEVSSTFSRLSPGAAPSETSSSTPPLGTAPLDFNGDGSRLPATMLLRRGLITAPLLPKVRELPLL